MRLSELPLPPPNHARLHPARQTAREREYCKFHSRFREECLAAHWSFNLADARFQIETSRRDNEQRPRSGMKNQTPIELARVHQLNPLSA